MTYNKKKKEKETRVQIACMCVLGEVGRWFEGVMVVVIWELLVMVGIHRGGGVRPGGVVGGGLVFVSWNYTISITPHCALINVYITNIYPFTGASKTIGKFAKTQW